MSMGTLEEQTQGLVDEGIILEYEWLPDDQDCGGYLMLTFSDDTYVLVSLRYDAAEQVDGYEYTCYLHATDKLLTSGEGSFDDYQVEMRRLADNPYNPLWNL